MYYEFLIMTLKQCTSVFPVPIFCIYSIIHIVFMQDPKYGQLSQNAQNADPNVAANALGKISLLNNQQEQTVTEAEFLKTTSTGHRGVRLIFSLNS